MRVKDKLLGFFDNAKTWLKDAGRRIIQGLLDGVRDMGKPIGDAMGWVGDKISRFLPGSPVKEGPLRVLNDGYAGGQIAGMVAGGIERGIPDLSRTTTQLAGMTLAPFGIRTPSTGDASPVRAPHTPPLKLDVPRGGDGGSLPAPVHIGTLNVYGNNAKELADQIITEVSKRSARS